MTKFGLEDRHWQIIDDLIVKPLSTMGLKVYVFGSRARGDHLPFSDIDILVAGGATEQLIRELSESLEESNLPIRVDLVRAEELAPSYRTSVIHDRVPIR